MIEILPNLVTIPDIPRITTPEDEIIIWGYGDAREMVQIPRVVRRDVKRFRRLEPAVDVLAV